MSPDLDRLLCERYPRIFRYRNLSSTEHTMGRGLEIGDGWFALVDVACAVISGPLERAQQSYEFARRRQAEGDPTIDAAALEHARLEIVAEEARLPTALQVKEKFGGLRIRFEGGDERTRACKEFAELLSGSVCEQCGKPGTTLKWGGRMQTCCGEHSGQ